jgi:predicted lysophospholipase L1 biosynthesis ABC-type transport system permease subunit
VRTNRRDLAVLRALGSTRGQLDAVTAWQAAPFLLATLIVGLPIGVALGRWAFTLFARSLAVVDDATVSVGILGALVASILVAFAIAAFVSVLIARRDRSTVVLRGD